MSHFKGKFPKILRSTQALAPTEGFYSPLSPDNEQHAPQLPGPPATDVDRQVFPGPLF